MKTLCLLVAVLLLPLPGWAKKKPKPQPTPYMDGILLATKSVATGDFTCTQDGETSHCTPDTRWVYVVNLGGEILPVVPVASKKSIFLGLATMGRSEMMSKGSILWSLTKGEHFQYRLEGINIRIKAKNRDSVYTIYVPSAQ